MNIIDVKTLLDVPDLQESFPGFVAVTDCDREKIFPEMEVSVRSNGETFKVKIEEVNDQELVGKVLQSEFYFDQPFGFLDFIRFEKKNVIDIFTIYGVDY